MLSPGTKYLMEELEIQVESLLHYSDSSSPYIISAMGKGQNFMEIIRKEVENKPVEEITAEQFFSKLVSMHPWQTEEERVRISRYKSLENFLKIRFKEVKVIKIGELNLDIHIVGETEEGDFILLSTNELHLPSHISFDY